MRAEQIRDLITGRAAWSSQEDMAACPEFLENANQRLREAKVLRESGFLEESVRVLEEPVDIYRELALLDPLADALESWRGAAESRGDDIPPAVDWGLFEEAIDARARAQSLRPLLALHHHRSFLMKSVDARYAVLERLSAADPRDPAWHAEMKELEPDRLRRLIAEATSLLAAPEVVEVEALLQSGHELPQPVGPQFKRLEEIRQAFREFWHIGTPAGLIRRLDRYVDGVKTWMNALRDFERLRLEVDALLRQKRSWDAVEPDWNRLTMAAQTLRRPLPPELRHRADEARRKASVLAGVRVLLMAVLVLLLAGLGWLGYRKWDTRKYWAQAMEQLNQRIDTSDFSGFDKFVIDLGPESRFPPDVRKAVARGRKVEHDLSESSRAKQQAAMASQAALEEMLEAVLSRDNDRVTQLRGELTRVELQDEPMAQLVGILDLDRCIDARVSGDVSKLEDPTGTALCERMQHLLEGPTPKRSETDERLGMQPLSGSPEFWDDPAIGLKNAETQTERLEEEIAGLNELAERVEVLSGLAAWIHDAMLPFGDGLRVATSALEARRDEWSAQERREQRRVVLRDAEMALVHDLTRVCAEPQQVIDKLAAHRDAHPDSILGQESRRASRTLALARQWKDWMDTCEATPFDPKNSSVNGWHERAVKSFLQSCPAGSVHDRVQQWSEMLRAVLTDTADQRFADFLRIPEQEGWTKLVRGRAQDRTLYFAKEPERMGEGVFLVYLVSTKGSIANPTRKSVRLAGLQVDHNPFGALIASLSTPFESSDGDGEQVVLDILVDLQVSDAPAQIRSKLARELLTRALNNSTGWVVDHDLRALLGDYLEHLTNVPLPLEWDWLNPEKADSEGEFREALARVPVDLLRKHRATARERRKSIQAELSPRDIVGFVNIEGDRRTVQLVPGVSPGRLESMQRSGPSLFREIGRVVSGDPPVELRDGVDSESLPFGTLVLMSRDP